MKTGFPLNNLYMQHLKLYFVCSFLLGFANDQFSFQDPRLGNRIVLKSDKHEVECDITPTDVSEKRVACETR